VLQSQSDGCSCYEVDVIGWLSETRSRVAVATSLGLVVLLAASRQQPLAVDARRLALGTDSSAVFLVRGSSSQRIGTVTEQLWTEVRNDSNYLVRVTRSESTVFGLNLDTAVSTWPGLEPASRTTRSGDCVTRMSYRPFRVLVHGCDQAAPAAYALDAEGATVYDGSTFDLLLRASALVLGDSIAVKAFVLPDSAVTSLRANVVERSEMTTTGSSLEVWKVQMDFAGLPATFWIDTESRQVVQQLIDLDQEVQVQTIRLPDR